jgi:hypothetical protein
MTITIERVIQEISPLQSLEKAVSEAEAKVADWRRSIAAIETQMNTANATLARASEHRAAHALQASLGAAAALEAVKHARGELHNASQTIEDLQISLPEAQAHLAEAEKCAASARHELARFEAGCLARERVKAAARIDTLISELSTAFAVFDKLGHQIGNMAGLLPTNPHMSGMSMSRTEEIRGDQRVRSALPKVWLRFFPGALHSERAPMTLEASEIQIWSSLASLETTTTKAA